MKSYLAAIDRHLTDLQRWQVVAIAVCGVAIVAAVDYVSGYEISISVFYLVPVATASWYAGRRASVGIAILACISWFVADIASGHPYEYRAIPVWNALVRFGFFLINGLLVVALRDSLFNHRQLARVDDLTGAFGRRAFEERLEHDLDLARRNRSVLTLAFVDLDKFKTLNDTRGHAAGDQALRAVTRVLQGATRRADTVARLGGDEFALVLPGTTREGAERVVSKVQHDLGEALKAMAPELTCSIGVITFDGDAPRMEEALQAADALMYRAKREGRNSAVFSVATAASA